MKEKDDFQTSPQVSPYFSRLFSSLINFATFSILYLNFNDQGVILSIKSNYGINCKSFRVTQRSVYAIIYSDLGKFQIAPLFPRIPLNFPRIFHQSSFERENRSMVVKLLAERYKQPAIVAC